MKKVIVLISVVCISIFARADIVISGFGSENSVDAFFELGIVQIVNHPTEGNFEFEITGANVGNNEIFFRVGDYTTTFSEGDTELMIPGGDTLFKVTANDIFITTIPSLAVSSNVTIEAIPEPSSIALMSFISVGLYLSRKKMFV